MRIGVLRLAVLAMLAVVLPAPASAEQFNRADVLAAHNKYRAALGLSALRWSEALATSAQRWADQLAAMGRLQHSGSGQNLAMATSGSLTVTQLVDLWGNERTLFIDGYFPAISSTGNWADVGHYSQIVWKGTAEVGCGFARRNGHDVLVCNYSPPGNVMGERAY